jgi:hypothetical protein
MGGAETEGGEVVLDLVCPGMEERPRFLQKPNGMRGGDRKAACNKIFTVQQSQ